MKLVHLLQQKKSVLDTRTDVAVEQNVNGSSENWSATYLPTSTHIPCVRAYTVLSYIAWQTTAGIKKRPM